MLDVILENFTIFVPNLSPRLSKMQCEDIDIGLFSGNILVTEGNTKLSTPHLQNKTIYFPDVFLNFLWSICFHTISITEETANAKRKKDSESRLLWGTEVRQAIIMKEWALSLRYENTMWPTNVCDPLGDGKYHYMVGLVFKYSLAFIMFHEYAHGKLNHDPKADRTISIAQEIEADNFALQSVYSEIVDEDERRLYLFGVICAGVTMLYAVTDPRQVSQEKHPDIDVRLFNYLEFFDLPESNERRYVHLLLTIALRGFLHTYGISTEKDRQFSSSWEHVQYLAKLIDEAKSGI